MDENLRATATKRWSAFLLALACGLATFAFVRAQHPVFHVSSDYDIGMGASDSARMALYDQTQGAARKNAMLIFALGGGLLGGALAAVASGCCKLPVRVISGLAWGGLWGLATGFIASYAQAAFEPRGVLPSVTSAGLSQATAFALLGAGIGLMIGVMSRSPEFAVSSTLTVAVAAGAGGFLYAVIVGFVAQTQNESQLVPGDALAQLLWLCIPFAAIGLSLPQAPAAVRADAIS